LENGFDGLLARVVNARTGTSFLTESAIVVQADDRLDDPLRLGELSLAEDTEPKQPTLHPPIKNRGLVDSVSSILWSYYLV